jgi:hypothetical protein
VWTWVIWKSTGVSAWLEVVRMCSTRGVLVNQATVRFDGAMNQGDDGRTRCVSEDYSFASTSSIAREVSEW